jgi:elongation factor 2
LIIQFADKAIIKKMTSKIDFTRSISIIAHIDHGKSTLTDSFVSRAGLISDEEAGTKRWTDGRDDEKARGITIKSTGVSMDYNFEGENYHVNLVDSPGHIDFSSEVSAALRITDGAVVVVDAVEGVCVQTETVLRQALMEQVKPILLINKMDRYIFELHLSADEAYDRLVNIINKVNEIIDVYQSENSLLKLRLSPELGNVFFSSALHGWGFGIHNFARLYAAKSNATSVDSYMKKLWGEHYFNPDTRKIVKTPYLNGTPLQRTFSVFILGPIFEIVQSIINSENDKFLEKLSKMGVILTPKDLEKTGKDLYKIALKKFLPVVDALLFGVVHHLPSPKEAQKYRYTTLYDGPLDDECAVAIRDCDPSGPLMIYISKMIPMENSSRFYAFGRIFSGTVDLTQKITILGSNYKFGGKTDLHENKSIQRIARMVGSKAETCESLSCGNTVALVGIDQYLLKSCTITTCSQAHPIKTMKFSVSPVVRVSVSPVNPADLPKLNEGLKKLSKSDPCVQVIITEDEMIVAGVGELHVEICLNDLRNFVKADIKVGDPVVPLRESILVTSNQVCLAKSPNKHNRLYMTACPLNDDLVDKLATKKVTLDNLSKSLVTDYSWDATDAKKIWSLAPQDDEPSNLFVDITKGAQYLSEIKEHVLSAFQQVALKGVLCEEPVQGVRFNLNDILLHADTIHRGPGQLIPASVKALYASMLTAQPVLLEPVYLVEILVPNNYTGTIYNCLHQKRGKVISEEQTVGNINMIKGYLPVMESFNFNSYIKEQTSGQAFPQMTFHHWDKLPGDPLDPTSKAGQIVRSVRKRKGLSEDVPDLSRYLDKL